MSWFQMDQLKLPSNRTGVLFSCSLSSAQVILDHKELSHLRRSPLSLLGDLASCSSFHLFSSLQDRPPLLLRVSDGLLNVDFPALDRVLMVTHTLAPPPQVVHRTVTVRFGAQDALQTKHTIFIKCNS